jgi:hypothetical protein
MSELTDALATATDSPARLTAAQLELIKQGAPPLHTWAREQHRKAIKGQSQEERLGAVVGAALKQELHKRDARIAALEQEMRDTLRFCGVWKTEHEYRPGDAVTHQGGLWVCRENTTGRPNVDHEKWTLAVKSGSAGHP